MIVALWFIVIAQFAAVLWLGLDKINRGGFGSKALSTGHKLHKVYYKKGSYSSTSGWAWRCGCGVGHLIDNYSNPSEERALGAWKKHQAMYAELALESSDNKYKVLYEDKQAELEKYKETCYCKDVH